MGVRCREDIGQFQHSEGHRFRGVGGGLPPPRKLDVIIQPLQLSVKLNQFDLNHLSGIRSEQKQQNYPHENNGKFSLFFIDLIEI